QYTLPVGERGTWFAYIGYPGEPALGPVAFMHRASASENPSATLSHHLQDSTHISFGVFTTGFTYRWFKLEGSIFNGREPDENRYDFDSHKWNSRSSSNWKAQSSTGASRTRTATTSTRTSGTRARHASGSCRTGTGPCRSLTVSCAARKHRSRTRTYGARPPLCNTTCPLIEGTGHRLSSGDAIM